MIILIMALGSALGYLLTARLVFTVMAKLDTSQSSATYCTVHEKFNDSWCAKSKICQEYNYKTERNVDSDRAVRALWAYFWPVLIPVLLGKGTHLMVTGGLHTELEKEAQKAHQVKERKDAEKAASYGYRNDSTLTGTIVDASHGLPYSDTYGGREFY